MPESQASTPTAESEAELAFAGLEAQALMLVSGKVSSRELVELCLRRIAASQPSLNAFRVVCEEAALKEAAAADQRLASGDGAALLGVPIAIKDDVDLAGHSTPFGCGGSHPPAKEDAELVRRLRAAGAIVIGKTQAPEVGQWPFTESAAFGATRNPWNTGHTPGGSSGGAAAAVAAGLVAGAIGSDGAGSVRIPAAWTGLVGLKPQRGRISTWPDPEAFNGLTCFGPLTRSVGDAALLLDAVAGDREGDLHRPPPHSESFAVAASQPLRPLRVALSFATPFGVPDKVDPEVRVATERIAERLVELGHEVVPADPRYGLVGLSLVPRGMAGVHEWLCDRVPDHDALEPRTRVHSRLGRALSGPPLRAARAAEPALARRIGRIFERVDVVLTPTTAAPPPRIGALEGCGYWATSTAASAACPFAFAWNVVGWPGLSVPAGFTAAGLPIGAQLLGQENDEATLLALGGQLEAAADGEWTKRRPAVTAANAPAAISAP
jgi:amidase